jgi:hypothetical protein
MRNSYKAKIKQFTNKFPNKSREEMERHLNKVRSDFQADEGTVRERYRRYLTRIEKLGLRSLPSFTSYSYVVYCKEKIELDWLQ